MTIDANAELAKDLWPRVFRIYMKSGDTAAKAEITKIKSSIGKGASGLDPSADLTSFLNIAIAQGDA